MHTILLCLKLEAVVDMIWKSFLVCLITWMLRPLKTQLLVRRLFIFFFKFFSFREHFNNEERRKLLENVCACFFKLDLNTPKMIFISHLQTLQISNKEKFHIFFEKFSHLKLKPAPTQDKFLDFLQNEFSHSKWFQKAFV